MLFNSDLDMFSELAKEAGENALWREFSAFADRRGRGLRAEALRCLDAFLAATADWSFDDRLAFTRWLLERIPNPVLSMPQPLQVRLVVPTVREWAEREPESAEARMWLGLLQCDDPADHLARAVELDPACDRARWTLVEWIIDDVEYNQHELPDFYIHDPRNDLPVLDRADALIAGGGGDEADRLRLEVAELRRLAKDWLAAHPREGDFAQH